MTNQHLALLNRIRAAEPHEPVPTEAELAAHLAARRVIVGETALAEFAYVQSVAAARWGPAVTSHFGRVLRQARATAKVPRRSGWDIVCMQTKQLPEAWRTPMCRQIEFSRAGRSRPGATPWSSSYASSVVAALVRWVARCEAIGASLVPTGLDLDCYAEALVEDAVSPVSIRTAADYVGRIHAGLAIVAPTEPSLGRDFVVRDWREKADRTPRHTKVGAQLVGASAIYALGFDIIDAARLADLRGVHAAKDFRNGLILALGTALPQRARALGALAFGSTLTVEGPGRIHVQIPARFLKMPEGEKALAAPFERTFKNAALTEALEEYRQEFRPIFDDGAALFPSVKSRGSAISEKQIGRLTGDMTLAFFGKRISIHRLRDNVATEASEDLVGGRIAASVLLDHRDVVVTGRHYDRSNGLKAGEEFDSFIEKRRQNAVGLDL